jgi:RNA polymerase sigma-70 factor (ECF subfamily)
MFEYHGKGSAWDYRAVLPGAASAVAPREEFDAAVSASLYMFLPTLKPEYAEVLWRADLVGEQRDRTAKLLGTTVNNVGVRLYRARTALRKRLEQMCVTCPNHGFFDCTCEYANAMRTALAGKGQRRG